MKQAEPFDRGKVVISLDTELGWGRINSGEFAVSNLPTRLDAGKEAITKLLQAFEMYEIPATWAVVGQLFRDLTESPSNPEIDTLRPIPTQYRNRNWWRMPDLIRQIYESRVGHEIGSHSCTHALFDKISESEVALDIKLYAEWRSNVLPDRATSFVFPQNRIGHRNKLFEAGFSCYRGTPPLFSSGPSPTAFLPSRREGLVDIPTSIAYRPYDDRGILHRSLPRPIKIAGMRWGVRLAAKTGRVCHVTLHPKDFAGENQDLFFKRFRGWLAFLDKYRDTGLIDVMTMNEVAQKAVFEETNS